MKKVILIALFVAAVVATGRAAHAEDALPLPAVEDVLKRVAQQVEKEQENEQNFKLNYIYTRAKTTEFKNSKGEVKKSEAKKSTNDPIKRRERMAAAAAATAAKSARAADDDDAPPTETKSNVKGKAFERSDFPASEDLMARYVFTLVRRENISGRPTLVIDFVPADKKLPERNIKEKFLNKAAGRVWVDEKDSVPVKADLYLTSPVSVLGGLVGAVHKFKFTFNRSITPEGVWFTKDSDWHLEGREVFIKRIVDYHEEITNVVRVLPPAEPTR